MEALRLYIGRLKTSPNLPAKLFCDTQNGLLDLNLLCATYLRTVHHEGHAYELADLWMPPSLSLFFEREEASHKMLANILDYGVGFRLA